MTGRPKGLRSYFGEATAATPDDVTDHLWNRKVTPDSCGGNEPYNSALLEQYKLYVEMADRVSARRALANTFFLTLNTGIFTAVGILWAHRPAASTSWLGIPLIAVLLQCATWFWTIRTYRQLNSGKWAVVGALEERLPASPYWRAEWVALGEGRDPARYWPLTHVEQWIPLLFALAYLAGFVTILAA